MTGAKSDRNLGEIIVTVKVFGALRQVHGVTQEQVHLGMPQTVHGLLEALRRAKPDLVTRLETGLEDGYLSALVNGRNIRFLEGLATSLDTGDTVAFLPPVGGG